MVRIFTDGNSRSRFGRVYTPSGGGGGGSNAIATGGAITIDTPTLVEHEFTADGTFHLTDRGMIPISFTITGSGSFDGVTSSGTADVGVDVAVIVTSGSVVVSYDPTDFELGHPAGFVDLMVAWFDAADTATITDAGSGAVSQWDDKSGNGQHLVQATGSRRPTTGVESQNGHNTISFDSNDHLWTSGYSVDISGAEITVMYLLKEDRSTNYEGVVQLRSSGTSGLTGFQMWRRVQYPALTFGRDTTFSAGNYRETRALGDASHTAAYRVHVAQVSKSANTYSYRISGSTMALTTESGSAAASSLWDAGLGNDFRLTLGANIDPDATQTQPLDGKLGFVIILAANAAAGLTGSEITNLETWHRNFWGVA